MKSISRKYVYMAAAILSLLCLGTAQADAQEEQLHVAGRVHLINKVAGEGGVAKDTTIYEQVFYGFFGTKEAAQKALTTLQNAKNNAMTAEEFRTFCRKNGLASPSKSNGTITPRVALPGQWILAVTKEGDTPEHLTNANQIVAGKVYYDIEIEIHRAVGGTSTRPKKVVIDNTPWSLDDRTVDFPISFKVPKDKIKKSTRIIVQPYAIDCQVEDTMSYLKPIVFEGNSYHALQDKRMDFDYFNKDLLGTDYYIGGLLDFDTIPAAQHDKLYQEYLEMDAGRWENVSDKDTVVFLVKPLMLDTISDELLVQAKIRYILPKIGQKCKGPFVYALEDYHRVYYTGSDPGTCLQINPFKFIDFTAGLPEMELTTHFYEAAESQFQKVNNSLDLRFVQGKDILTEDSTNVIESEKMRKELTSQENLIGSSLTIVGTSSPEGGDKLNQDLAWKRARAAKRYLSNFLRNVSPKESVKLYTWEDVAVELEQRYEKRAEAQAVRDLIAANSDNKSALDKAMKQLDFYEKLIEPILAGMRLMRYTYMFETNHVMDADEVVASYHTYKDDYIAGTKKLSSGDFYNLYANITDSIELDTITNIAYRYLESKRPNIYAERIAPYVYNRRARMLLDKGTPDTLMLKPFIDEPETDSIFDKSLNRIVTMPDGSEVCMNFQDICITQAMNFYQLRMYDRAYKYIKWIKALAKNSPEALDKLVMYMDLIKHFNDDTNESFVKAKNYVLNSSPDNKAILYTEIPSWEKDFDVKNNLLDMMDDSNPKKWYLKGILWATKVDEEPDLSQYYPEDSFHVLTEEEEKALRPNWEAYQEYLDKLEEWKKNNNNVDISKIKHYLAYFHHSFKLEPTFKRLYYTEGHVNEELRKSHKYLKKDFAGYEELFTLLKARDDENREVLMIRDGDIGSAGSAATAVDGAQQTTPVTPAPDNTVNDENKSDEK